MLGHVRRENLQRAQKRIIYITCYYSRKTEGDYGWTSKLDLSVTWASFVVPIGEYQEMFLCTSEFVSYFFTRYLDCGWNIWGRRGSRQIIMARMGRASHVLQRKLTGKRREFFEQIYKNFRGSDYFLQLESMKQESLVIADQQSCGEYVLELCTHCPSRSGRRRWLQVGGEMYIHYVCIFAATRQLGANWSEVVTR